MLLIQTDSALSKNVLFYLNIALWPFPELTSFLRSCSSFSSVFFPYLCHATLFSWSAFSHIPDTFLLSLNRMDLCIHNDPRGEWAGLIQPTARKGFDDVICMNEPVSGLFPLRWKWEMLERERCIYCMFLLNQTGDWNEKSRWKKTVGLDKVEDGNRKWIREDETDWWLSQERQKRHISGWRYRLVSNLCLSIAQDKWNSERLVWAVMA